MEGVEKERLLESTIKRKSDTTNVGRVRQVLVTTYSVHRAIEIARIFQG